ncbi:MAG: hypothetical protein H6Q90_2916 [Deltaproteobacteria bacterium]|nr:hypothetical protein [Deltaproteobacteria bacterium]
MRIELHVTDRDDAHGSVELGRLRAVFPAMAFELVRDEGSRAITASSWLADDFDFWSFDRELDDLADRGEPVRVSANGLEATLIAEQVATRAQRLAWRCNAASHTAWFERVLHEHRALHDLGEPFVRADYDHALDTWQWTLRREPGAGAALQLAALLHEIERLVRGSGAGIVADDYRAFKDAHARAGARLADELFYRAGVPLAIAAAATALIAVHEHANDNLLLRTINDADALSFFSLNSPGYLAYFGAEQTNRKVLYTLARMSPAACRELAMMRIPRIVNDQVRRALTTRITLHETGAIT